MTDTRGWPQSLLEVVELVGVGPALRLVDAYGGTRCYVPHRLPEDHHLITVVGRAAARTLHRHYAGQHLDVPVLAVARHRKRAIAEAAGGTKAVAQQLGVTERYVRMVRNAGGPGPRQLGLFEAPKE